MQTQNPSASPAADENSSLREQISQLEARLTEERERRRLVETFNQINTAINSSLNTEEVLDSILDHMSRLVPHDAACLMMVEGTVARVYRWQGYADFDVESTFSPHLFHIHTNPVLHEIQENGASVLLANVEDGATSLYTVERSWIKSHISAPIFVLDQMMGVLNVDSATANFFDQEDVDLLESFTNLVSTALKNAQLYDQARQAIVDRVKTLRKERNFADAVLDTAGALVMVLSPEGRILKFNRACVQTTGYTFEEVKGQRFWDLFVSTDQLAAVKSIFAELQSGQLRNEYESFLYTKDRRKRLIAWANTVLLDQHEVVEYIISSGVDVTERRQLRDRLLAIHHMGRELNLLQDEAEILQMTLETATFLLEFKSAGYGLLNDAGDELDYYYQPVRGVSKNIELTAPMELDARITMLLSHSHEALESFDGAQTLPVFESIDQVRRSWLSVPMRVGERVVGVVDVQGHEPDHFSDNEQQLLQTLADQTAVALENAQLHQESRQRVDELSTMNMISQAVTATLDLEETLTLVTRHAIRLLDASDASVALYDEARGDLWFHAASGRGADYVRGKRMPEGKGIIGWVIQHGEPLVVPNVAEDDRFFSDFDEESGFETQCVICVPMQNKEETIGAIEVINKQTGVFTAKDLRLLTWLATPATIAIQNARLFEQIHMGHKRLKSLSRRLVEAQEIERRNIALELHDEAGQSLTSLMVGLGLLERQASSPEAVVQAVLELKQQTNDILENLHRLAINLRPASLDHVGLVPALKQYTKNFSQQHDLEIQFEVVGLDDRRLPATVETNLYRIVQEVLTNVVRHARAGRVDVLLERRNDRLVTIIEDDGVGFDPQTTGSGRLGLLGMRERAEMLDGTVVVESTPGTGTTVYVEVPYDYSNTHRG